MADCRLYLITPPALPDLSAFVRRLEDAFSGGDVAALQVRLKDADERQIAEAVAALTPVCARKDVMVILNDRPDLAARLGCDGVHIGQSDAPYDEARRLMGKDRVVGVTCHDSLHLAMEAAEAGADYVAFGAFYPTSTKDTEFRPEPDLLTGWQQDMLTPCVAIGGITVTTAADMARAGADYLAVTAGVWGYPEGPAAAVAAFNAEMARGVSERGF
ncbi:MAG: thiamine phosphate synthase [Caulobacteraceae bacterium]